MQKSIHSPAYRTFLRLLREARCNAGVTQGELAELLGESQSFVSKCERGERRLDIIEARAFCEAIGERFPKFADRLERAIRKGRLLRS